MDQYLRGPTTSGDFTSKTDWSQNGMRGALCQPDCNKEEEKAMKREMEGRKCELDKIMSGLRLRLIETIARACKGSEKHEHSSKGKPRAGIWAFLKWKRFLWYSPFTWITDCSCLEPFFEMDIMPTHTLQRWRMVLRFNFTIVHRP
jgi:5-methylcytosine-specific restriction endonuclease McrA